MSSDTDWLERRIREVVDGISGDDAVDGSRPFAGRMMVVAMKLRMPEEGWAFVREQMRSWVPRINGGKYMSRYESDYPTWYDSYTPSVGGESYTANARIDP